MTKKFPNLKDFPQQHKISLFEAGSLIGLDDLYHEQDYTTTLTCSTQKGHLFGMKKDQFLKLSKNPYIWNKVQNMVAFRNYRRFADDIKATSKQEIKEEQEVAFRQKGDPWLFELLMEPRHVKHGVVMPYDQHPEYLHRIDNEINAQEEQNKARKEEELRNKRVCSALEMRREQKKITQKLRTQLTTVMKKAPIAREDLVKKVKNNPFKLRSSSQRLDGQKHQKP